MTEPLVVLVCADLMTASRLETAGAACELRVVRTPAAATAALDERRADADSTVVVVDLTCAPGLPKELAAGEHAGVPVIGFAPHVQEQLIEDARPFCVRAVPRGSVIKRFEHLITTALDPGI